MNVFEVRGTLPKEVQDVVDGINEGLDFYDGPWGNDPHDFINNLSCSKFDGEWVIGPRYREDDSTIYRDGQWFYRDCFTGNDKPVKGGAEEVVADWLCYFMG